MIYGEQDQCAKNRCNDGRQMLSVFLDAWLHIICTTDFIRMTCWVDIRQCRGYVWNQNSSILQGITVGAVRISDDFEEGFFSAIPEFISRRDGMGHARVGVA